MTSPQVRKRLSNLWAQLNRNPEMKEVAAKIGFELDNAITDQMDAFMKEKTRLYAESAQQPGLDKK